MGYPAGYEPHLSTGEIFQVANESYRQNDLEKAVRGYEYLASSGIKNGYLYYNLGNTFFRMGELGRSILWYERALEYLPRFEDLQVNYRYARNQLVDEDFRIQEYTGTLGFFVALYRYFNLRESLWITLVCFWVFGICLIAWIFMRHRTWGSRFRIPCWITGLLFIIFFLSTSAKIYQNEFVTRAIVMSSAVDIKTGPSAEFSTSFTLHEGTQVKVVQNQGDWVRITLPSNPAFNGWMPRSSIQVI